MFGLSGLLGQVHSKRQLQTTLTKGTRGTFYPCFVASSRLQIDTKTHKKKMNTYQVTLDIEEEAVLPQIHCPVGTIEDAVLAGIVGQIQEQIEKKVEKTG